MLDKNYRISLAKPQKFGRKISRDNLVLRAGFGKPAVAKFAVVVPVKFCPRAVDRNRTKRLIWQSLATLKEKIKPGVYKILVTGNFSALTPGEVLSKVAQVFEKGELIAK